MSKTLSEHNLIDQQQLEDFLTEVRKINPKRKYTIEDWGGEYRLIVGLKFTSQGDHLQGNQIPFTAYAVKRQEWGSYNLYFLQVTKGWFNRQKVELRRLLIGVDTAEMAIAWEALNAALRIQGSERDFHGSAGLHP